MKKIIALILAILALFTFASCSIAEPDNYQALLPSLTIINLKSDILMDQRVWVWQNL